MIDGFKGRFLRPAAPIPAAAAGFAAAAAARPALAGGGSGLSLVAAAQPAPARLGELLAGFHAQGGAAAGGQFLFWRR